MEPATRKVLLRKGMKFDAIINRGKGGKVQRKKFVGPCEVEMTEDQIKSFKDLLQTAPQVIVESKPEPEPEPKDPPKGSGGDKGNKGGQKDPLKSK